MDLSYLAATAALEAAKYLGKKVGDGVASSLGGKIVDWLRSRLNAPLETAALDKLQENPSSAGAQRVLEGVLLSRLETDPALAQSLYSLLKAAGPTLLTQYVSGESNNTIQIAGNHNAVSSSDRS